MTFLRGSGVLAALFALLSCATMPRETGFLDRDVRVGSRTYPYVVFVPRDYDPSRKWPVILFLHGAGERGSDGLKQTQIGINSALRADAMPRSAIVVLPQAPAETRWLDEPVGAAMRALEEAITEWNGDRDRVYVTGLSMGGYGTIHFALAHRDVFAAGVVVCGGLLPHPTTTSVQQSPLTKGAEDPYAFVARELRSFPLWLFHGSKDTTIPPEESRRLYENLKKEGSAARYTEYEGVGHNSWDRAYREKELWEWLFAQRLRAR